MSRWVSTRPRRRCPTAGSARRGPPASRWDVEGRAAGGSVRAARHLLGIGQGRGHRPDDGHGRRVGGAAGTQEPQLELPVRQGVAGAGREGVGEDGRHGVALAGDGGAVDATSVRGVLGRPAAQDVVLRRHAGAGAPDAHLDPRTAGRRGVPRGDELGQAEARGDDGRGPGRDLVRDGSGHRVVRVGVVDGPVERSEDEVGAGPRGVVDVSVGPALLALGRAGPRRVGDADEGGAYGGARRRTGEQRATAGLERGG